MAGILIGLHGWMPSAVRAQTVYFSMSAEGVTKSVFPTQALALEPRTIISQSHRDAIARIAIADEECDLLEGKAMSLRLSLLTILRLAGFATVAACVLTSARWA
jgi:hypothetical protein